MKKYEIKVLESPTTGRMVAHVKYWAGNFSSVKKWEYSLTKKQFERFLKQPKGEKDD